MSDKATHPRPNASSLAAQVAELFAEHRKLNATVELVTQRTAEAFFAERIKRSLPRGLLEVLEIAGTDEPEPECDEIINPKKERLNLVSFG
jgi:hypothetical protein